jgi:hypothetical protein
MCGHEPNPGQGPAVNRWRNSSPYSLARDPEHHADACDMLVRLRLAAGIASVGCMQRDGTQCSSPHLASV